MECEHAKELLTAWKDFTRADEEVKLPSLKRSLLRAEKAKMLGEPGTKRRLKGEGGRFILQDDVKKMEPGE